MSDNELIIQLQTNVLNAINSSQMPLMVKSLVVENALLKLNAELKNEQIANLQANQEVNLHVDTLEMNTGTKDKQAEAEEAEKE
jgi:hypothetical protein